MHLIVLLLEEDEEMLSISATDVKHDGNDDPSKKSATKYDTLLVFVRV